MTQLAALGVALVAVVGIVLSFWAANSLVDHLPRRVGPNVRPWIFVGPAVLLTLVGLAWPAIRTIDLSLHAGKSGSGGLTIDQWTSVLEDPANVDIHNWQSIIVNPLFVTGVLLLTTVGAIAVAARGLGRPSSFDRGSPGVVIALGIGAFIATFGAFTSLEGVIPVTFWWMLTVPTFATIMGFGVAVLADGRRGETIAKSVLFMPMAVSLVGAGVIWRFIYYANTPRENVGLINAILNVIGLQSVDFYNGADILPWNNVFLMIIVIWIYTGFAVVVFSSAVKSVPTDLIEVAKMDGATGFEIAWYVILPLIRGTTVVVVTTITIFATKIFDVIKATTDGASGTEVLGLAVFRYLSYSQFARSAVFAVIILALVAPFMVYSLRSQLRPNP